MENEHNATAFRMALAALLDDFAATGDEESARLLWHAFSDLNEAMHQLYETSTKNATLATARELLENAHTQGEQLGERWDELLSTLPIGAFRRPTIYQGINAIQARVAGIEARLDGNIEKAQSLERASDNHLKMLAQLTY